MRRLPAALIAVCVSVAAHAGTFDKGMALLDESGTLKIRYLSSGKEVNLAGNTRGCFSPDMKQVVMNASGGRILIQNIDGTGTRTLTTYPGKTADVDWVPSGYVYYCDQTHILWRIKTDGTGKEQVHNFCPAAWSIGVDNNENYALIWGRKDGCNGPPDNFAPNVTVVLDLNAKKVVSYVGGCQGDLSTDGTEWFTMCNQKYWNLPRYDAHQGACVFDTETGQPRSGDEMIVFTGVYMNRNFYIQGTNEIIGFTDGNTGKGYLFHRTTKEKKDLGVCMLSDYCTSEVTMGSNDPSLALSTTDISFTQEADGTISPAEQRISVTNERGGTLDACVVSGNPGWLQVQVQGSGNSQVLVNAINAELLPADKSAASATVVVSAANSISQGSYTVSVAMASFRAPDDASAATSAGLAWYRYDGDCTDLSANRPASPDGVGYVSGIADIELPSQGTSYFVLTGFLDIGAIDVYTFGVTGSAAARVSIGQTVVAGSGSYQPAENSIGLQKGQHAITIEFCAGDGTAAPVFTVAAQGALTAPLDGPFSHVPFEWENTIQVTAPNGGETYAIGDTLHVTWSADCRSFPSVVIRVTVDDGENWHQIVPVSEPCDSGAFDWVIPETLLGMPATSAQCRVQVADYNGATDDFSDGLFGIGAAPVVRGTAVPRHHGIRLSIVDGLAVISGLRPDTKARVTLSNMQGRVVSVTEHRAARAAIAAPSNNGLYFCTVQQSGKSVTIPLVTR